MGYIIMREKELEQNRVLEGLVRRELTQASAASRLGITDRQVRNKLKRFKIEGSIGLLHKNRGRPSKRKWDSKQEALALDLLRSDLWKGFGPTFAAEKLKELHGINVNKETLRKAMIQGGVWVANERKYKHRKRRERKACLGMMIQLDGSDHDWFEGRGPKCTLLVFIDDATSRILWLEFVKSESLHSIMKATRKYMEKHGRPKSFYVDWGKVFRFNVNNAEHDKLTQWERALEELGVEVIHAGSPEAKGRVERSNDTHQDRLVKEMRLAGISSMEAANQFLRDSNYIERHNASFAEPPAQIFDAHQPVGDINLDNIFCLKDKRILQKDYVIMYKTRIFQLQEEQKTQIKPKDIIRIHEHLDGAISLHIRSVKLRFTEITQRPEKVVQEKICNDKPRKVSKNNHAFNNGACVPYRLKGNYGDSTCQKGAVG